MRVFETDRWCKSKIDPGGEKPEKQGETASSTEKNLEKEEVRIPAKSTTDSGIIPTTCSGPIRPLVPAESDQ
jgi:hypothetical protein